jgi:hypothetical protein
MTWSSAASNTTLRISGSSVSKPRCNKNLRACSPSFTRNSKSGKRKRVRPAEFAYPHEKAAHRALNSSPFQSYFAGTISARRRSTCRTYNQPAFVVADVHGARNRIERSRRQCRSATTRLGKSEKSAAPSTTAASGPYSVGIVSIESQASNSKFEWSSSSVASSGCMC